MQRYKLLIFLVLTGFLLACPLKAGENPSYTLEQLITMTLASQPQLTAAQAQIEQKQGASLQAYSNYYPQIGVSSGYNKTSYSTSVYSSNSGQWSSSLSLQQFLTDFGKTSAGVKSVNAGLTQAQLSYRETCQTVLLSVYQNYYSVLQNKAQLEVQQKNLDSLRLHLEQATHFYKAGTKPKIDVTQAGVNLLSGEYQLQQASNDLAVSLAQLATAVGRKDLGDYRVAGELAYRDYSLNLEDALTKAFLTRPDLLAAQVQVDGARANLLAKERNLNPSLNGNLSYNLQDTKFPPQANSFYYGLSLSLPVFDGYQTKGAIVQARGQLKQYLAQLDSLQLTVFEEVKSNWLTLQSNRKNYQVAQESVKLALENRELAQQRYQAGVGSYLEFFDAQYNYLQAQSDEINALAAYNSSLAALKQAMGILE